MVMVELVLLLVPPSIPPKYIIIEYFKEKQKSITEYKRFQRSIREREQKIQEGGNNNKKFGICVKF